LRRAREAFNKIVPVVPIWVNLASGIARPQAAGARRSAAMSNSLTLVCLEAIFM
jgi:hypothetical protein